MYTGIIFLHVLFVYSMIHVIGNFEQKKMISLVTKDKCFEFLSDQI